MIIVGIIMILVAAICLMIGILHLMQKGPLINNAWIYANEEQRRTMDKKPHYRQSGIVFLMIGLQFIMIGLFCFTKSYLFMIAEGVIIGMVVVYAIVSSIIIDKNKR